MPRSTHGLKQVLEGLVAHDVEFIVIGGMSAALQGVPIVTWDLDIVQRRTAENVNRLVDALTELGAYYREHEDWKPAPTAELLLKSEHSGGIPGRTRSGDRRSRLR